MEVLLYVVTIRSLFILEEASRSSLTLESAEASVHKHLHLRGLQLLQDGRKARPRVVLGAPGGGPAAAP